MTEKKGFSKVKILTSKQFTPIQRDVLSALLDNDEIYTIDEAKRKLDQYLKKEAK